MSIFKRTWWVSPEGKACDKNTPGAKLVTARKYTIQMWVNGNQKRFPGSTDRRVTEQKEAKIRLQFARGEVGMVDPFSNHKSVPLRDHWLGEDDKPAVKGTPDVTDQSHIGLYTSEMESAGRDSEHVYIVQRRLWKLCDECGFNILADITVDAFTRWRGLQQRAKKKPSPKTLNEYLQTLRAFCRWCVKRGRMAADPMATVEPVKVNGDVRRQRRALTETEVARLLANSGERKAVYLTAVLTGLRRAELAALQWGDIHLDAPRPFMKVRGSTTKNGKDATIWLRDDVVKELRSIKSADADDTFHVFVGRMPSMDTFRKDLAAGREAWIKEAGDDKAERKKREKSDFLMNANGKRIDFHALRHTLGTNLARAGVPVRVAMEVMRHSDSRLTTKTYTDAGQLPTADAMDVLPRFDDKGNEPEASQLRATGTDNATAVGTGLGLVWDPSRQIMASSGPDSRTQKNSFSLVNTGEISRFPGKTANKQGMHQLGLEASQNAVGTPANAQLSVQVGTELGLASVTVGGTTYQSFGFANSVEALLAALESLPAETKADVLSRLKGSPAPVRR